MQEAIAGLIEVTRKNIQLGYPSKEARDVVPEETRRKLGIEVLDEILNSISVENMNLFQQFIYWMGNMWWYYNTTLRSKCFIGHANSACYIYAKDALAKFIVPILPAQVSKELEPMEMLTSAIGFGHFAFLFGNNQTRVRRIVTDTSLIEIHDAAGYSYLDIDQYGNPIARFCTSKGGERAFFDGVRLMSHDRFQTCAPKTVLFDRGYKFNSTKVSVVNGVLYPLIDADDAVAKTTGAFFGAVNFTPKDFVVASEIAEESAARLSIEGDKVVLDGVTIKPIGTFQPSHFTLLESGFTLYEWSKFKPSIEIHYDHVMVVDDKAEWIQEVSQELDGEIGSFVTLLTNSADEALEAILKEKPEVLILDMHLTEEGRFDGLFIANLLFAQGFPGAIYIASSYDDNCLQAMAVLINGKVSLPGKNISRIRDLLSKGA